MNLHLSTPVALLTAALLTLAGCAADNGIGDPGVTDEASPTEDVGAAPSLPTGEVPTELLADVVSEAAARANVSVSEVEVVTAEAVTWPSGAIGCPEPGEFYTQALVPGYRVVIEVDGEELHYHAAEDGTFTYCEDPEPPVDADR